MWGSGGHVGAPSSNQSTGQRTGVLTVAQQHLAADDGGGDAPRALHEAAGAGRQVVGDLRHLGRNRVGIEDDEVGHEALAHEAAVGEAPVRGRHQREHAHRVLQREDLPLAHPVAQQMRLQRGVDDLRDVRAGVGERHHRARVLHHRQHVVLHLVGDRVHEEPIEVLLQRQVDQRGGRIDPALARDVGHRAVRALHGVVDEDPLVREGARLGAERLLLGRVVGAGHQAAADFGIAKLPLLLVERQRAERLPRRQVIERQLGLEREQHVEAAAVHLGEHAPAGRRRLVQQGHVARPHVTRVQPAEGAERDGPARLHREVAQAHVIVAEGGGVRLLAADGLAGQLEDTGVELAHHADQPAHLVPRGQAAGHRPAVGRLVNRRARGGEADGARLDGLAQLALHQPDVVLARRLLERALAHDVAAERAVADVARVVDALGQGLDGIEELGEGRPRPRDACGHRRARDVLGPLEVADDQSLVLLAARRQREAAVAHDHRGDAVPARAGPERIPEHLRVHVRVTVDEPGSDHAPLGVDDLAGTLADAADGDDAPVVHADVGAIAGKAGAVDDHAILDHEVVRHRRSPPRVRCAAILHRRSRRNDRARVHDRNRVIHAEALSGPR